ncbi:MAG TPA: hypothetical protein VFF43_09595 [Caldimonas sp.]|nr:hypothetical protein [Caldimonas sp.]
MPRSEPRAVAAALTLLLHALVVFALLRGTTRPPEPPRPPAMGVLRADALRDAGERLVNVDIVSGPSTNGLLCPGSTYVGIGITADPRTQRIILVGDDTPASRAGLQHDDIVLNPEVWNEAHREGALLRVLIVREGVKMIVPVRVGWICIG